jgi:hypothetical protein
MISVSNDHTLALMRATDDLIETDTSGLPIGRLAAIVAAGRDQVLSGCETLGTEVGTPAEYVRIVMELARQDINLMRVPGQREEPDALAPA